MDLRYIDFINKTNKDLGQNLDKNEPCQAMLDLANPKPICEACKNDHNMIWHEQIKEWICHATHRI